MQNINRPPQLFLRFFRWFCHPKMVDYIEGDLIEVYERRLKESSKRKADLRFVVDVLLLFRPAIIRSIGIYKNINQTTMINNYIKIGWRNINRHRSLSFINIFGLSTGLTCFALIALWVSDELSYDRFNANYDRIVRVTGITRTDAGVTESAMTGAPMAQALKNDFPEVEEVVRLKMRGDIVTYKGQQFYQPGVLLADPSFFNVFSFELTKGNRATALGDPFTIILTESAAAKYFGRQDPIGETLTINMYDGSGYGAAYKITGVMPDPPRNSHFNFTMMASFSTVETANPGVLTKDGWGDASFYTYVLMREGADVETFSEKIKLFYGKYVGELFNVWRDHYSYKVQPLRDIHLRSNLKNEIGTPGNINQIYLLSTIGIFILVLAGINYVNLAVAGSTSRVKEVGMRKVAGALKSQLVLQYLFESILTALIAFAISVLLSTLLQPLFFQLTGKDIFLFSSLVVVIFLTAVTVLVGILSGLYPAAVLSGLKPLRILKGNYQHSGRGISVRQSLMIVQFTVAIVLVNCIVIFSSQMRFIQHKDLGYDNDALVFFKVNGNTDIIKGYDAFRTELLRSPLVSVASISNTVPIAGLDNGESETLDKEGKPVIISTARLRTDSQFLDAYGLHLLAGRNLQERATTDTLQGVLINEAAIKTIGWESPQDAIGRPFDIGGTKGEVIGVVRNFHFSSLYKPVDPLVIYPVGPRFSRIIVKASFADPVLAMDWIEKVWKTHFPSALFDYEFVDSVIADQYEKDVRFAKVIASFSCLSLVIACLGLYGLVSHAVSKKVKEIGIRKVLGATVSGITLMLSKDFLKRVVLAIFVAIPASWYVMSRWLENFAYKTSISWWMLVLGGVMVLILSIITVSFQTVKAGMMNPVKSLRSE
jgi:putative ABC transport system permease protein